MSSLVVPMNSRASDAVARADRSIAEGFEQFSGELPHRGVVFDDQDDFSFPMGGARVLGGRHASTSAVLIFNGEGEREGGSAIDLGFEEDVPVVLLDDPVGLGKAEAGASTAFLGGEEGFENVRPRRRWNTTSGVGNAQPHPVSFVDLRSSGYVIRVRLRAPETNPDLSPTVRHGLNRVEGEVGQDLLELDRVDPTV